MVLIHHATLDGGDHGGENETCTALVLAEDQKKMLKELSRSRTAPACEIERAKILIGCADGISITGLQR
ncbi:hypothetical protein SAMN05428952_101757 [Nitrosomonas sp. Nm132]|nr:hypothetical protein SAMN05428952_101757 [Nitrosomonas sp. Nm132]